MIIRCGVKVASLARPCLCRQSPNRDHHLVSSERSGKANGRDLRIQDRERGLHDSAPSPSV